MAGQAALGRVWLRSEGVGQPGLRVNSWLKAEGQTRSRHVPGRQRRPVKAAAEPAETMRGRNQVPRARGSQGKMNSDPLLDYKRILKNPVQ